MKKINFMLMFISLLFLVPQTTFSQIMNIQKFIGKSPKDLINTIGKPVKYDDSDPSKIFIYYNLLSLQCLADQNGIYKADLTKYYTSELEAIEEINELISSLISEGYVEDSISEHHFALYRKGVKIDILLTVFYDSPKMELKVEAIKQSNDWSQRLSINK